MRRACAVAVVAAVACESGMAASPRQVREHVEIASGARLKAVVWEIGGDPDVRRFDHFFDLARNEECAFVDGERANVAPGPVYYCLPRGAAVHDVDGLLALYEDASCTAPVALSPFDGPSGYVVARPRDACAASFVVHRAGAPRTIEPYVRTDDGCLPRGGPAVVQSLGEVIPLASFVRAVEEPALADTRIRPLVLAAADGARQPLGGWDDERKEVVRVPNAAVLGEARWFPARVAFAGGGTVLFSRPGCEAPALTKNARDAQCPLTAAFAYSGECGGGDYVALGARLDPATLWQEDGSGRCVGADGGAGASVLAFARGPVIPRASFAEAVPTERGAGRVRLHGYAFAFDTFYDTATSAPCAPMPAADGTTRCLPTVSASGVLFADPACTIPALEQHPDPCGLAPLPAFVRSSGRVFEVTDEVKALFERDGASCRRRAVSAGARAYVLVEVDLEPFAPATTREL
ncbi:MAG: hypothetical protein KIT84_15705 [Labilithrix sp.]|nr:hypothetical protein [Labilithrix sp.]MCW5812472.1 hypothetical protein [Labilithrix sp.]